MPTVVATIWPKAEHRQAVVDVFRAVVPKVHEEDGCELYALHEADDRLVLVEQWTSGDALQAHLDGPTIVELNAGLNGRTERQADVVIMSPVPLGDPGKGVVVG
ncbi:MAG: antibiotic biosynthesis monooxygenase [Streptosporangiales bacterium]|nr:antibiotic biosynthesis monooxygenase [Streptosporangiales bacterium]